MPLLSIPFEYVDNKIYIDISGKYVSMYFCSANATKLYIWL